MHSEQPPPPPSWLFGPSIRLIPAYKPLLVRGKPTVSQMRVWSEGTMEALQDYFEHTDWDMFKAAAIYNNRINMDEYAMCVSLRLQTPCHIWPLPVYLQAKPLLFVCICLCCFLPPWQEEVLLYSVSQKGTGAGGGCRLGEIQDWWNPSDWK